MNKSTIKDFISKARLAHGDKYDYSKSTYVNAVSKVEIICKKHGPFLQKAAHHTSGVGCQLCGRESTGAKNRMGWAGFIEKARVKHGERYEYQEARKLTSESKVKIKCLTHGWFEQCVANHLSGSGCNLCAVARVSKSQAITFEEFLMRSKLAHGNRYAYSSRHMNNCKEKVEIICRVHGPFEQVACEHYSGKGCIKCGYVSAIRNKKRNYGFHGYSRTKYIQIAERNSGGISNLYIIKASSEDESFFKIGISVNSVKHRFASHFPYTVDEFIEIPMAAGKAWDAERYLHRMLKDLSYRPKIKFNGYTECFSEVTDEAMSYARSIK